MVNSILCATDGSRSSEKAVAYAIGLAYRLKTPLTFITVHPSMYDQSGNAIGTDTAVVAGMEAQVTQDLAWARTQAIMKGLTQVETVSVGGRNVAGAIVAYAERLGHDQIVVGHAGRSGIMRLAAGSVAAAVSEQANCPVTLVK